MGDTDQKTAVDSTASTTDPKKRSEAVSYWLDEITASKKREEDYRKDGKRIIELYEAKDHDKIPFNILLSNTETLLPALYSAVPRPLVQRRFKDDDPIGKAVSQAGQRALEFMSDTNIDGYETFDEGMRNAVLNSLLPGRGVTFAKYDAEIGENPPEKEGEKPTQYKKSELVCIDSCYWDMVYFGYARKWPKVPWMAKEENIDEKEAIRLFGDEKASKLTYNDSENQSTKGDETKTDTEKNKGKQKTTLIYQIWDKSGGRKVRYISPEFKDDYLLVQDDPLELTGFFPCPKPLQFIEKTGNMVPTAMYMIYENQAKELNRISIRINKLVEACKARGLYDSELGADVAKLLEEDENALVPATNPSSLAAEKGLSNAIWMMPIDVIAAVLEKLYTAREQCKRVIYEITGISDIIRGSSVASETATAQNLKSQWGTLRLKRLQKAVHWYARDLLRIMLEIAATKFSQKTWAQMTGLPFATDEEVEKMQALITATQQVTASGQPISPKTQQQIQAFQAKPKWADVLQAMQDDMQRAYRVDIETNSTVEPEATEDHKDMSEMMTAMGQFMQGVAPMVESGTMPFQMAQAVLLTITRKYRFGVDIEDQIKSMQPPQPKDDGKAAAAQIDMQMKQMEIQMKQMEAQAKQQEIAAKAEADKRAMESEAMLQQVELARIQREADVERELKLLEMELKREEHQLKMEELRSKHEVGMAAGRQKLAEIKAKEKEVGAKK